MSTYRNMTVGLALIPIITLIISLVIALNFLGAGPHIPLVFSTAIACLVTLKAGYKWDDIEKFMLETMSDGLQALVILLIVGMLIGTWIISGVVPTMIYYGLLIISPTVFLAMSYTLTSIVAFATGSSWSTAGTVGIALVGIGQAMNIPLEMVAGTVVAGAYFGDKMSPLSDTTNLGAAISGAQLFEHIKHVVYPLVPSFIISIALYAVLGFQYGGASIDKEGIDAILNGLSSIFVINPIMLIPPLVVIVSVIKKMPAIPGLFISAFIAALLAMGIQGASLSDVISVAFSGYESHSGSEVIDSLLSRGGMVSMGSIIALVLVAMGFGGIIQKSGMLPLLLDKVLTIAKGIGGLICATVLTGVIAEMLMGSQYLSVIVTGSMYKDRYAEKGLAPKNLSRCVVNSGCTVSPLVPWSNCGAFMAGTLGVATLSYAPFAFSCYLTPIISIIIGFIGFTIERIPPAQPES